MTVTLNEYDLHVLGIIAERGRPIRSYVIFSQLEDEFERRSTWGRLWLWRAIFGPSFGQLFSSLWKMERDGVIESEWNPNRSASGHRARLYRVAGTPAAFPRAN